MSAQSFTPKFDRAVVFVCDENYLPPALFVAHQLSRQPIVDFDIIAVVVGGVSRVAPSRSWPLTLVHGDLDERLKNVRTVERRSPVTYARLTLARLLPPGYRKILYLDPDMWIGERPISRLLDVDLGGYPLAAVRDALDILRPGDPEWRAYKRSIGLDETRPYFNSGAMLIDVESFARADVAERVIAHLTTGHFAAKFDDQCALNCVAADAWRELSPVWNWMFSKEPALTREISPAIIHFIGANKPWKDRRGRHPPRYREAMSQYLSTLGLESFVEAPSTASRIRRAGMLAVKSLRSPFADRRSDRIKAFLQRGAFWDAPAAGAPPSS